MNKTKKTKISSKSTKNTKVKKKVSTKKKSVKASKVNKTEETKVTNTTNNSKTPNSLTKKTSKTNSNEREKTIIYYYSKTNNNQYLANKIATQLDIDIEEIKPRLNILPLLIFSTTTRLSFGIKSPSKKVSDYDNIILCGPIWMGKLISPLRDFIKKNKKSAKKLYFITCCGTPHEKKDSSFGYTKVFRQLQKIVGKKLVHAQALPVSLVLDEEQRNNPEMVMKARFSDETFKGEVQEQLDQFLKLI